MQTDYQYDGNDIVAEISGGAVSAGYLRSLSIDEPFVRQSSTNEYYHVDALGSTLDLTDETGAVATNYEYAAFGKTTINGTSANPLQYTGRENDGTGLYYYRARYYSPESQRFISQDPIKFNGIDFNIYGYVQNNPIRLIDPFGLKSVEVCSPPSNCFTMDVPEDTDIDRLRDHIESDRPQEIPEKTKKKIIENYLRGLDLGLKLYCKYSQTCGGTFPMPRPDKMPFPFPFPSPDDAEAFDPIPEKNPNSNFDKNFDPGKKLNCRKC